MNHIQKLQSKIVNADQLKAKLDAWRIEGKEVVFTNGCFDLLHKGHIDYLNKAADLGDELVIGLNADASVERLKGSHRPIQSEDSRAWILAALECVSLVVLFTEDTPINLILEVKPDVLVKGGDYSPNQIVGSPEVIKGGGKVEIIPFLEGFSTSKIESKIKQAAP